MLVLARISVLLSSHISVLVLTHISVRVSMRISMPALHVRVRISLRLTITWASCRRTRLDTTCTTTPLLQSIGLRGPPAPSPSTCPRHSKSPPLRHTTRCSQPQTKPRRSPSRTAPPHRTYTLAHSNTGPGRNGSREREGESKKENKIQACNANEDGLDGRCYRARNHTSVIDTQPSPR